MTAAELNLDALDALMVGYHRRQPGASDLAAAVTKYEYRHVLELLADAGYEVVRVERQPREHPVPCRRCHRPTWNVSALCDDHAEVTG